MSRAGMKCILVASTVLFCAAAIGSASAQSIQLHKQTKTAPLPASVKPTASKKPAALTATQVFSKASSSVVVVKATDADGKILATGSGLDSVQDGGQARAVVYVAVMQEYSGGPFLRAPDEVIDSLGVECGRAAHQSVHLVTLCKEILRKVGTILSRDPCDECPPYH